MDEMLHIEEFKVRLRPADAARLRELARQRDIPPAVLLRALVVDALGPTDSLPVRAEEGRPAEGLHKSETRG